VNHLPPSSAEVKEKVEIYLYTPCGTSRSFLERNVWSISTFLEHNYGMKQGLLVIFGKLFVGK
jgi:hypothetical protein